MDLKEKALRHLRDLRKTAEKSGLSLSGIDTKEFNHEFTAIAGKERIKVQVYFGKKGLKTVLQGDLKSGLYIRLNELLIDQVSFNLAEQEKKEPEEYIGTDEVGKGDFFGPLVVAAVYTDPGTREKLKRIGVRDSKEIGDLQILQLAREINEITQDRFEVVLISPSKYNDLYGKLKNLNQLLNWAHSKAIDNLLDNTECKYVITDKFSRKDLDVSTLSAHADVEFVQETKAERFTGVAAASIIARGAFLEWFDQQAKKGYRIPKGASLEVEDYAKKLLKKIGPEKFDQLVKKHFKTYNKIL